MRLRLSVRSTMILIAVLGLTLWLVIPAVRILRDPARRTLVHLWQKRDGRYLFSAHPVEFWPRYRHALLGQPWDCTYPMCQDNRANATEIATASSVSEIVRDHPEAIMGQPR